MNPDRKRHAQALQNNPLLAEVLEKFESDTVTAWRGERDPAMREAYWARMQAITLLKGSINVAIKRELGDKPDQQQQGE
jgi:hypothetical protein